RQVPGLRWVGASMGDHVAGLGACGNGHPVLARVEPQVRQAEQHRAYDRQGHDPRRGGRAPSLHVRTSLPRRDPSIPLAGTLGTGGRTDVGPGPDFGSSATTIRTSSSGMTSSPRMLEYVPVMGRFGVLVRRYGFDALVVLTSAASAVEVALRHGEPGAPTTSA